MPSPEDIANQQELLAAYRRTLAQLLKQQALISELFTPPAIANGIDEARENIRRLKSSLRAWGVPIEDFPTDEAPAAAPLPAPLSAPATRERHPRRIVWLIGALALVAALGVLVAALVPQLRGQKAGLRTSMYWSQCASSAVWVLPGTILPAHDSDRARDDLEQAITTKKVISWQVAGLDPSTLLDKQEPGGERQLYVTVSGAGSGKIDIHLFNVASVSVTAQPSSQPIDVATFWTPGNFDCISGGGGANNRTFPSTELIQKAQQYADDKQYAGYDYFTLNSESSEDLVFPFTCSAPGVYTVQIGLRYRDNILAVADTYRSDQPATIICPSAFTYWPITYTRNLTDANKVTVQIGTPRPFHWDGKRYIQGTT